jgi:hypothetical protein
MKITLPTTKSLYTPKGYCVRVNSKLRPIWGGFLLSGILEIYTVLESSEFSIV